MPVGVGVTANKVRLVAVMSGVVIDIEPEVPPFLVEPVQTLGIIVAVAGIAIILGFAVYAWWRRYDLESTRRGLAGALVGFVPLVLGILLFWLT